MKDQADEKAKQRVDKFNAPVNFIVTSSEISRNHAFNHVVAFGQMYDLDALLHCYEWACENDEIKDDIFETIMHDLRGIREGNRLSNFYRTYTVVGCRTCARG